MGNPVVYVIVRFDTFIIIMHYLVNIDYKKKKKWTNSDYLLY